MTPVSALAALSIALLLAACQGVHAPWPSPEDSAWNDSHALARSLDQEIQPFDQAINFLNGVVVHHAGADYTVLLI